MRVTKHYAMPTPPVLYRIELNEREVGILAAALDRATTASVAPSTIVETVLNDLHDAIRTCQKRDAEPCDQDQDEKNS